MSSRAAARLVEIGYRDVFEYPGGIKEWRQVVGRMERAAAPHPSAS